ncbi:hypothetical protein OH76DRAFT_1424094 [Lentinus brumalis]|uniref:Uncharacterized protein n=1 Tax=Lentinus brumalis TaxID=2498619 RepID=A0A371CHL9_9APHY|nr:hypothetical protein OH76DRAFT_1424094 [Polyporus brumalis]
MPMAAQLLPCLCVFTPLHFTGQHRHMTASVRQTYLSVVMVFFYHRLQRSPNTHHLCSDSCLDARLRDVNKSIGLLEASSSRSQQLEVGLAEGPPLAWSGCSTSRTRPTRSPSTSPRMSQDLDAAMAAVRRKFRSSHLQLLAVKVIFESVEAGVARGSEWNDDAVEEEGRWDAVFRPVVNAEESGNAASKEGGIAPISIVEELVRPATLGIWAYCPGIAIWEVGSFCT